MFNAHASSRVQSGGDSGEQQSRQPQTPEHPILAATRDRARIYRWTSRPKDIQAMRSLLSVSLSCAANQVPSGIWSEREIGESREMELAGERTRARHEWTSRVSSLAQHVKNIVILNHLLTNASRLNTCALLRLLSQVTSCSRGVAGSNTQLWCRRQRNGTTRAQASAN